MEGMQVVILPRIDSLSVYPTNAKLKNEKRREDLVETWRRTHTAKEGVFRTKENERLYGEMKAIQKAIKDKKMDPKTDRQIIDEVLASRNRGHIAGVGRVVPGTDIFPGSTYTRGGPSTTHSDPLDLDNCYKPVSVDEDDSSDGNSEHDNVGDDGSGSEFDDDE